MSNTTKNLVRKPYGKGGRQLVLPVDAGSHIYDGTMVSQLTATAMLAPATTAAAGPVVGVAMHEVDDSAGSVDGAKRLNLEYDCIYSWPNGLTTDACSETTPIFSAVYAGDDHTIYDNDNGGTKPFAGLFMGMNEDGTVRVFHGQCATTALGLTGAGAASGGASTGWIPLSLHSAREVDANGDVSNIAANGGILASDTTPIMRGDAAESVEISWAAGNVDPIQFQTALPGDFDGSGDVTLELWVNSGSTDAATFVVETSWDGGALVVDSADDAATKSATRHRITATIAAADVVDTARQLTIALTPPTHATNAIQLLGACVAYNKAS